MPKITRLAWSLRRSFHLRNYKGDIMTYEEMAQPGSTPVAGTTSVSIADVRFEHRRDALGIGAAEPRLSWIVATEASGWRQAGYEIEAYGPDNALRDQTGRVASDQSVLVPWPFPPLTSRE